MLLNATRRYAVWPDPSSRSWRSESCENSWFESLSPRLRYACNQKTKLNFSGHIFDIYPRSASRLTWPPRRTVGHSRIIAYWAFIQSIFHWYSKYFETQHSLQQYAYDTQLFLAVSRDTVTIAVWLGTVKHCQTGSTCHFTPRLVRSQRACCHWMKTSLRPCSLISTRQRLHTFPAITSVNIASSSVAVSKQVTTLGVILDCNLTFDSHVSAVQWRL